MKSNRTGILAVAIAAAFFAGSVVAIAVAGDGAQSAKKKKKVKKGPQGPAGPAGPQGAQGPAGAAGQNTTSVVPIDYVQVGGSATPQTVFSANGFTLTGLCSGVVDGVYSSTGSGPLYVKWETFLTAMDDVNTSGGESSSFTKQTNANIADIFLSDDLVADGQMIYDTNGRGVPGGKPISITFHLEETGAACVFTGTATVTN